MPCDILLKERATQTVAEPAGSSYIDGAVDLLPDRTLR